MKASRVLLCTLAAASLLPATQILPVTLGEMADLSEVVVHARVTGKHSAWDGSHRILWTHYDLEPVEFLKGTAPLPLRVSEPGGTDGEVEMSVPGAPVYEVGEEVVLFLETTPIGFRRTCGWGQGRFNIERRAGEAVVYQSRLTAPVAGRRAEPDRKSLDGLSLGEFKIRLRSYLQPRATKPSR